MARPALSLLGRCGPLLLVLFLAPLAALGCHRGEDTTAQAETPPTLVSPENLAAAERQLLRNGPLVSGSLTAERQATIRAEIAGKVLEVLVEQGQPVTKGQRLAQISDEAAEDGVISAKSAVRTAQEALAVAKRNAERSERLAAAGALAERDLEQAKQTALAAEAALADASARLASAEKQLAHTEIRSPLTGIISERQANSGDVASVGTALFTVVDPTSMRLEAQVPVSALEGLKIGTPVPFTVDGYADRNFEGKIVRINPAVDPATRQVRITVGIPNAGGRLVVGLFAQGRAAIESHEGVVVPSSAIDRKGVRPTVDRIKGGQVEKVEVTLGVEDPSVDRVEITSGLAAGDSVLIGAARGLAPGTKIRPAAAAERPASRN